MLPADSLETPAFNKAVLFVEVYAADQQAGDVDHRREPVPPGHDGPVGQADARFHGAVSLRRVSLFPLPIVPGSWGPGATVQRRQT